MCLVFFVHGNRRIQQMFVSIQSVNLTITDFLSGLFIWVILPVFIPNDLVSNNLIGLRKGQSGLYRAVIRSIYERVKFSSGSIEIYNCAHLPQQDDISIACVSVCLSVCPSVCYRVVKRKRIIGFCSFPPTVCIFIGIIVMYTIFYLFSKVRYIYLHFIPWQD